jgi:hypothetical protein
MSRKEFEDISIPKWKIALKGATGKVYRVFKNPSEFETVEAENASEAVIKSGITKVYMVKYGAYENMDTFEGGSLEPDNGTEQAATA